MIINSKHQCCKPKLEFWRGNNAIYISSSKYRTSQKTFLLIIVSVNLTSIKRSPLGRGSLSFNFCNNLLQLQKRVQNGEAHNRSLGASRPANSCVVRTWRKVPVPKECARYTNLQTQVVTVPANARHR